MQPGEARWESYGLMVSEELHLEVHTLRKQAGMKQPELPDNWSYILVIPFANFWFPCTNAANIA